MMLVALDKISHQDAVRRKSPRACRHYYWTHGPNNTHKSIIHLKEGHQVVEIASNKMAGKTGYGIGRS